MMRSGDHKKRNNRSFLWRGAVGGFFGGIIGIAVLHSFEAGSIKAAIFYWALLAMIRALPFTIPGGIIVGAIVLVITRRLGTAKLAGAIIGGIAGAIIGGIIGAILHSLMTHETHEVVWEPFLMNIGAITGAVAGIISGALDHKTKQ